MANTSSKSLIKTRALTPDRWDDVVALFGPRGACAGCWCTYWRLMRKDWEAGKGSKNRRRFREIVKRGDEPGVLAYLRRTPIGWCSIAPREIFVTLRTSRVLKPVDDQPVWSIVCFFVHKDHRGTGLSVQLIDGAVHYAKKQGARIVEAYPVEPKKKPMPPVFAWTGIASAFRKAKFTEVARRSETRPIMRRHT